jgi:hypothetical protein
MKKLDRQLREKAKTIDEKDKAKGIADMLTESSEIKELCFGVVERKDVTKEGLNKLKAAIDEKAIKADYSNATLEYLVDNHKKL